jgi:hypothetical protein
MSGVLRFAAPMAAAGIFSGVSFLLDANPAGCAETIHQYTDHDSSCRFLPRLGPNTSRFLGLSSTEQKQIMGEDPRLCGMYTQLAENLENQFNQAFPAPKYNINSCNSDGRVASVSLEFKSGPYANGHRINVYRRSR